MSDPYITDEVGTVTEEQFDAAASMPRKMYMRDLLPGLSTTRKPICYHDFPVEPPALGKWFVCSKCKVLFIAQRRRPKRTPKEHCFDCGHTTPKGPKQKKRWEWVEVAEVPEVLAKGLLEAQS